MTHHCARIFTTFEAFLEEWLDYKIARIIWKNHVEKHGNVPLIQKCSICSGRELKIVRKLGKWKDNRPTKSERDEIAGKTDDDR
jgi:hypothetical protein